MGRNVFKKWTRNYLDWNATAWPWERFAPLTDAPGGVLYLKNLPFERARGGLDMKAAGFYKEDGSVLVEIYDTLGEEHVSINDKRRGMEILDDENRFRAQVNSYGLTADEVGAGSSKGAITNWKDAIRHKRHVRRFFQRRCRREITMEIPMLDSYMSCGLDVIRDGRCAWSGPLWNVYRVNSRLKAIRLMKFWCRKAGIKVVDLRTRK